jgi:hypothetical protein
LCEQLAKEREEIRKVGFVAKRKSPEGLEIKKKPKETELYAPVKAMLEGQGYAVKGYAVKGEVGPAGGKPDRTGRSCSTFCHKMALMVPA